jgi:alkaline phosphatase D
MQVQLHLIFTMRSFFLILPLICLISCNPSTTPKERVTEASTIIAFGSCGDQNRPQPILEQVAELKPDYFIYLGDNIYSDTYSMDTLRMNYAILGAKPEFKKLKSSTDVLATWDDHDYGWNDSGRHYPFKEESKRIFLDFFGVPDSTVLEHDGIYYSVFHNAGDKKIQIIFPDMRTFRDKLLPYNGNRENDPRYDYTLDYSPYNTADSVMLGEAQWSWLEDQLSQEADLRIIASSTQFSITHNGYEAWANFPHEQNRMLDLIKKTNAEGVIFISGDVHYAEISKLTSQNIYPLYDVTSSGITSTWDFATPNDNRIDGPVMENNFGALIINWDKKEVEMQIHDADGKKRISRMVKFSDLKLKSE